MKNLKNKIGVILNYVTYNINLIVLYYIVSFILHYKGNFTFLTLSSYYTNVQLLKFYYSQSHGLEVPNISV